jgi:hypothetical protein
MYRQFLQKSYVQALGLRQGGKIWLAGVLLLGLEVNYLPGLRIRS